MQRDLWRTPQLVREAKKHGLRLRIEDVREFYRVGLLIPSFHTRDRRVTGALSAIDWEPPDISYHQTYWVRHTAEAGRLVDPGEVGFLAHHPFRRPPAAPREWWDGYLFSLWTELLFPLLHRVLQTAKTHHRGQSLIVRFDRKAVSREFRRAEQLRSLVKVLSVVDARFLPVLEQNWVTVSGIEFEDWEKYRLEFDAVLLTKRLGVDADEIARLSRSIEVGDGLGRDFGELVPFVRSKVFERAKGTARQTYSARKAVEVVARFLEELDAPAGTSVREVLMDDQRRLARRSSLDEVLQELELSPHPGVLLVVEGATEMYFAERVLEELGMKNDPSIIQIVDMGGDAKRVELVATTFAPVVTKQTGDSWELLRQPTRIVVATDPPRGKRPTKTRKRVLQESMSKAVKAQTGTALHTEAADMLIDVVEWSGACFEFAHFSDEEIAEAIVEVEPTLRGQVTSERVAEVRGRGQTDISKVWTGTGLDPRKTDIARALWPAMRQRLNNEPPLANLPDIVEVVTAAWGDALRIKRGRWHIPVNAADGSVTLERPSQDQARKQGEPEQSSTSGCTDD